MYYIPGIPTYDEQNNIFGLDNFSGGGFIKKYKYVIIGFVSLIVIYILYKYLYKPVYFKLFNDIIDNNESNTTKSNNKNSPPKSVVDTSEVDKLENSDKYNDDPNWNYDENCEENICPKLSCPDGSMALREKNKCCYR